MKLLLLATFLGSYAWAAVYDSPTAPAFHFSFDESQWERVGAAGPAREDVDKAMEANTLATVQRRQPDEKYRARFSVVKDDPTKVKGDAPTPLSRYAAHSVEFLKSQRFHVLSSGPATLPGVSQPAFEVVAHQRDFGLTFRQVIFLTEVEGKPVALLLTAATRTSKFDEYKPQLEELFASFRLGAAPAPSP